MLSAVDPYLRAAGQHLVEAVPQLEYPLRAARGHYAHWYVRATVARHNLTNDAPIEPYRLVDVPPEEISRLSTPLTLPRFRRIGLVDGGDWDLRDQRFEETDVYRGFAAHFRDGRPWRETEFYDRVLEEIEHGLTPWGCRSRVDLDDRCARLDDLYETIRDDGYRTQRELMDEPTSDPIGSHRVSRYARIINDEIAVDVARDGEFLFADGRNRLAIAKLLDVETIPVLLLRRHERWQSLRNEVARRRDADGRSVPAFATTHPDLEPLVESDDVDDRTTADGTIPVDRASEDDGTGEDGGTGGQPTVRDA